MVFATASLRDFGSRTSAWAGIQVCPVASDSSWAALASLSNLWWFSSVNHQQRSLDCSYFLPTIVALAPWRIWKLHRLYTFKALGAETYHSFCHSTTYSRSSTGTEQDFAFEDFRLEYSCRVGKRNYVGKRCHGRCWTAGGGWRSKCGFTWDQNKLITMPDFAGTPQALHTLWAISVIHYEIWQTCRNAYLTKFLRPRLFSGSSVSVASEKF